MHTALAWVRDDEPTPSNLFFYVSDMGPSPEIPATAIQERLSVLRKQLFVGPGFDWVLDVRLHHSSIASDGVNYPEVQNPNRETSSAGRQDPLRPRPPNMAGARTRWSPDSIEKYRTWVWLSIRRFVDLELG
jgi:hypothetical protein